MSKRPTFGSHFEKLRELGYKKSLDERKPTSEMNASSLATEGSLTSLSSILGQSLSTVHTVSEERCSPQTVSIVTVSKLDGVNSEPCLTSAPSSSQVTGAVPEGDTVDAGLREKRTVFKVDPVKLGPSEGFTKVPHLLLRGESRFSEPLDLVVYLHLFTYSHGFGRREADMSQAQLERFTGAAKNTIKRSLERLVTQGWIKCVQEFECARMSRRWLVVAPEDRSGKPSLKRKRTEAKSDTVSREPSPPVTGGLSGADTRTVSKVDPYLERDPKEKSKNSLSVDSIELREYFSGVKPIGKRESEWRAYQGLRLDFGEEQIAACLSRLRSKGVPGSGAPCHSPMGFLSKAMGQVLSEVQEKSVKSSRVNDMFRLEVERAKLRESEDSKSEQDSRRRELAFEVAFPSVESQSRLVASYADRFPMLDQNGMVVRGLAIAAWWDEHLAG
jgi:hypothetical protein